MANDNERDSQLVQSDNTPYSMIKINVTETFENTRTSVYIITHDKLLNVLNAYDAKVRVLKDWQTPFYFLISLVLTLVTSDFKNRFFRKEIWEALYVIVAFISFLLFLRCSIQAIANRRETTTQALIDKIKDDSDSLL